MMPNKTIYVADADLPIFEKAQQLAGENLSSTIVQALRRYVEAHDEQQTEYREITLRVGSDNYTLKRFTGRLIATGHYRNADNRWQDIFQIFQSAKDKIVVYHGTVPTWMGGPGGGWDQGGRGPFPFGGPFGGPFNQGPHQDERQQRKWERQQRKWGGWGNMDEINNLKNFWANKGGNFKLDVYDTLEAVQTEIPEDLYERVKNHLNGNDVETLDI